MSTTRPQLGAYFGLGTGLAMALAANLTYTWPEGPVMIGTGLTAPLVLPVVLWIRATFTPVKVLVLWVREASVVAVAAPAATLSYWHTYQLMLPHMPWWIALFIPLSADGVATISTLAVHHHRPPQKRIKTIVRTAPAETPVAQVAAPNPARTVADEVESRRDKFTRCVEWLRTNEELPSFTESMEALKGRTGASLSTAKRAYRVVKAEKEAS